MYFMGTLFFTFFDIKICLSSSLDLLLCTKLLLSCVVLDN